MLHYEFVPGIGGWEEDEKGAFFCDWTLRVSVDGGPEHDELGSGAFRTAGGRASHGSRDLGVIAPSARRLTIAFEPPERWPAGERSVLVFDLATGSVARNDP